MRSTLTLILTIIILVILLSGCSIVSYNRTMPDGTQVSALGMKVGTDGALEGASLETESPNYKTHLSIDAANSNQTKGMALFNQLLQLLVEGAAKGAKP